MDGDPPSTLDRGKDSLDPSTIKTALNIEAEKLEDIQDVVVTVTNGLPIYVRQLAKVEISHRPRLGIVGRYQKVRDGRRVDRLRFTPDETASAASADEPADARAVRSRATGRGEARS